MGYDESRIQGVLIVERGQDADDRKAPGHLDQAEVAHAEDGHAEVGPAARWTGGWLLCGALAVATALDFGSLAGAPLGEMLGSRGLSWLGIVRLGLLLAAASVVASSLVERLHLDLRGAERAVASIAVGAAAVGLVVSLLGAAGQLRAPILETVVLAALILVQRIPPAERAAHPRGAPGMPLAGRVAAALAVALTVGLIAQDVHALRDQAPGAVFYDDVSYHLPAAATWMRYGDLRMLRVEFGDKSTTFYPIFGETMSWVAMAVPGGNDFFARWSQFPAGLGLLLLVWTLTRRAGGTAGGAAVAVALALSIPRFLPDAMLSAGNDLWSAFWLGAALLFLLRLVDGERLGDALLLGVATGGLIGTKYLNLLWLPVLLMAAVAAGAARHARAATGRGLRRGAWVLVAATLTSGGFVYLRNLVVLGNPVFPAPLTLLGVELFPGWAATGLAAREGVVSAGLERLGAFVQHPELLGVIWSRLFLPGLLVLPIAAAVAGLRKRSSAAQSLRALAVVLVFQVVIYVGWIPDRRDIRYVLAAPILAGVLSCALLSRLSPAWRRLVWVGWGAWACSSLLAGQTQPTLIASVLGCAGGALVLAAPRWRPAPILVLSALAAAALALTPGMERYLAAQDRFEPAARALASVAGAAPVAVAYVGGNRPYFYYGKRLQNRVDMVPTQGPPESRFFDFGEWSPVDPYERRRSRVWFRNLDALAIDHVVVDVDGLESPQAGWLRQATDSWRLAAAGDGFEIWTTRPPAGESRREPPADQKR